MGRFLFLREKRSLYNSGRGAGGKGKKENELRTFYWSLALCELKNLKIFTLTIFWAFLCHLAALRAAEGVSLPIIHRATYEAKPIFQASHLFAEECSLLLSTLKRDLIVPFKKIFLLNQAKGEWPMSSIFLPCFIAQTSDRSCCNAVCKVCLEGMKTKQKIWWVFFFTACRSKGLHAVLSP